MNTAAAKSALSKAIEANGLALADATKAYSSLASDILVAERQYRTLGETIGSMRADLALKDGVVRSLKDERNYLASSLVEIEQ